MANFANDEACKLKNNSDNKSINGNIIVNAVEKDYNAANYITILYLKNKKYNNIVEFIFFHILPSIFPCRTCPAGEFRV